MQGISYWIDKRAQITPTRMAVIGVDEQLTYLEMSRKINQTARMLADHFRIRKGDRIAILSSNNTEYILLLFAIAKLGGIAVPLNIRLTPKELAFQINDSGAKMLVVESEFKDTAEALLELTDLEVLLGLDGKRFQINLKDLIHSYPGDVFNDETVDASDPYIICYTSGTTGLPKGAVLTQENMFWNAVNNNLAIDITSEDRVITLLPLFHIGGIGLFAFPALLAGGSVIIPGKFDPEVALSMIEKYRVTIVMGVPTIHDALRKCPAFEQTDLSSIRWFYSGGAPCPHELISFYLERGIPFGQGFGMTETSPTVFMLSKEDYSRKIGSIGKPAMFCDIRIVDDKGNDVSPEEIGELLIKGPNVMKGYWNLPEETAKTIRDGWLYSGDLVRQDEEGFVYIAGRKKEMIISGGENIYPLEVEQVILELPQVAEVAVIGISDEKWGEVPKAILALKAGAVLPEEIIRKHCEQRLAKYKVPKEFEYVESLPKNSTGKIDKAGLKRRFSQITQEHRLLQSLENRGEASG
jgi:fatty-acyl-CoA synthase